MPPPTRARARVRHARARRQPHPCRLRPTPHSCLTNTRRPPPRLPRQVYRRRRQGKVFWQLSDENMRMMSDEIDSQLKVAKLGSNAI